MLGRRAREGQAERSSMKTAANRRFRIGGSKLAAAFQEYIARPMPGFRSLHIPQLGSITELVAILVCFLRFFIIQPDADNAQFWQRIQFCGFGNAVMVCILPQLPFEIELILRLKSSYSRTSQNKKEQEKPRRLA